MKAKGRRTLPVLGLIGFGWVLPLGLVAAPEGSPAESGPLSSSSPHGEEPLTAEDFHEQGLAALREGKLLEAAASLEKATRLEPKSALYVTDLGFVYQKLRREREAELAFESAIELDPKRPHAYGHLVDIVVKKPDRWADRGRLLALFERGINGCQRADYCARIELAMARAERALGRVDSAKRRCRRLLDDGELSTLVPTLVRDLRALLRAIEDDETLASLRDWPEPEPSEDTARQLGLVEKWLATERAKEAFTALAPLLEQQPSLVRARHLRARAATTLGYFDEAVKEYRIITRLRPSDAQAHRMLGTLLVEHGGLLELESADAALATALALEPEWEELDALRERIKKRQFGSSESAPRATPGVVEPSSTAQRLFGEAQLLLEAEPIDKQAVQRLLDQALRDSPTYLEAALAWYALEKTIPERTVRALWNDGPRLLGLYRELTRAEPPPPEPVTLSWLKRALALGTREAHLYLALRERRRGELLSAERRLASYLASAVDPDEMRAAEALRSEWHKSQASQVESFEEARLMAHLRLTRDDTEGALQLLGAPCRREQEAHQLSSLALVYERKRELWQALDCYAWALETAADQTARQENERRVARIFARGPEKLFEHPLTERLSLLSQRHPAAALGLARQRLWEKKDAEARSLFTEFLTRAAPDEPLRQRAERALEELRARTVALQHRHEVRQSRLLWGGLGLILSGVVMAGFWRFRGVPLAVAVRRRPSLYPELRRVTGELRHDVIKHRTSALGLVAEQPELRDSLKRTLLEPLPVSELALSAYQRLRDSAATLGIRLRPALREPTFGPLIRDLRRAEKLVSTQGKLSLLSDIDRRLRSVHSERLAGLTRRAPSCRLDPSRLEQWILAVESERLQQKARFVMPALEFSGVGLEFPVEQQALLLIFSNLLRNAEDAVQTLESPRLRVSCTRDTDFSGRSWLTLSISDNAPAPLSLADIESQAAGRGLAIIRDTARFWLGRVVLEPVEAPYTKRVGVSFAP